MLQIAYIPCRHGTIEVCLNDTCRSGQFAGSNRDRVGGPSVWEVALPVPADSDVHATVRLSSHGRIIFDGATTTHSRKFEPNGPGCSPTVWNVVVHTHDGDQLTT